MISAVLREAVSIATLGSKVWIKQITLRFADFFGFIRYVFGIVMQTRSKHISNLAELLGLQIPFCPPFNRPLTKIFDSWVLHDLIEQRKNLFVLKTLFWYSKILNTIERHFLRFRASLNTRQYFEQDMYKGRLKQDQGLAKIVNRAVCFKSAANNYFRILNACNFCHTYFFA